MTYSARIANVDHTRFDSLLSEDVADNVVHYKVNLHYTEELEYKANLSK